MNPLVGHSTTGRLMRKGTSGVSTPSLCSQQTLKVRRVALGLAQVNPEHLQLWRFSSLSENLFHC